MEYRRITKKGQITIPQKFREILGIKAGEKIVFDLERELRKLMLNRLMKFRRKKMRLQAYRI